MHGEKVSFGIVTQLLLDPDTDMERAAELVDFMLRLDLPVTMEDIGLDQAPEADLMAWYRKQVRSRQSSGRHCAEYHGGGTDAGHTCGFGFWPGAAKGAKVVMRYLTSAKI